MTDKDIIDLSTGLTACTDSPVEDYRRYAEIATSGLGGIKAVLVSIAEECGFPERRFQFRLDDTSYARVENRDDSITPEGEHNDSQNQSSDVVLITTLCVASAAFAAVAVLAVLGARRKVTHSADDSAPREPVTGAAGETISHSDEHCGAALEWSDDFAPHSIEL